jgi:hypothetical protein
MNYPQQQQQYGQGTQSSAQIGDDVLVFVPANHNNGVPLAAAKVTQVHQGYSGNGAGSGPKLVNLRVTHNGPHGHHRDAQEFLENVPLFDSEQDLMASEHYAASRNGGHFYGAFYRDDQ